MPTSLNAFTYFINQSINQSKMWIYIPLLKQKFTEAPVTCRPQKPWL